MFKKKVQQISIRIMPGSPFIGSQSSASASVVLDSLLLMAWPGEKWEVGNISCVTAYHSGMADLLVSVFSLKHNP